METKIEIGKHTGFGRTTYVGRVRYYDHNHYLFTNSTGIHRLNKEDAREDAVKSALDMTSAQDLTL